MKIELFELDSETHMVDLNKVWISTIKEFKVILRRDKGSDGDIDGRRKLQAQKEFTFIYHFCDFKSKFREYSEVDKLSECLRNADLPVDLDIYKDDGLLIAIERYKKFQNTATLKLLNELREGLHTAHKVVRKIRLSLENKLDTIEFEDMVEDDEDSKKKKIDPVLTITNKLTALMQITNQIPAALTSINALEDKVKKELGDDNTIRGDLQKGSREDKTFKKAQEQPNPLED